MVALGSIQGGLRFLGGRYRVCLKLVYGCCRVGLSLFRDRCVQVNSCKYAYP